MEDIARSQHTEHNTEQQTVQQGQYGNGNGLHQRRQHQIHPAHVQMRQLPEDHTDIGHTREQLGPIDTQIDQAEPDKKINARPEQKAKRRELGRKNYKTDKLKGKAYRKGKDLCHTAKGLRYKSRSANRGSKSDTAGDRNARG